MVPEFDFAVGLTFTAQLITAAVITFLLLGFYRQYEKEYLRHWTLGWMALAICQLAVGVAMLAGSRFSPAHPYRLIPAVVAMAAGYLHIAWTMFGVYEFVRRRPVRLQEAKRILIGTAIFGAVSALLFVTPQSSSMARHVVRSGLYGLIAVVAFGIASVVLWRARTRKSSVGSAVLSAAFAAHGLQQIQHAMLGTVFLSGRQFGQIGLFSGFVDLLLQSIIGLGMVACLLEDERESAQLAANEIEHLAYHDALTGLPNRPLYLDRLIVALAQANRAGHKLAVFFLDLDRFKDINDSLGHTVGDSLLKDVADRIRGCVREGDTVARVGGDEFTLLIPKIDHVEDVAKIAQKIIDNLKVPFVVFERELFVTTSIGVSIFPGDGTDPETLVRNADTAMYRAKEQGRDNYQLYAPAMNARAVERLSLENQLRKALSQNELLLHYQPIMSADTKSVLGVEALVRWQHSERGLVPPGQFIAVAELSGLIVPIGDWVLRTACHQLKAWQERYDPDLMVAVNLSARQFQQANLVDQIREVIEESGIAPSSLELEITESNAMQNPENTMYTLRELKAIGVRIAMDDFGTGYSSLNYLKKFPIDTLKLDQSFVRDVTTDSTDAAIVGAVITMAHSLNLEVVAEGIETEAQLEFLTRQGCDRLQGYLFSRPQPVDKLEPFLAERKVTTA
jgi:diguanylate cyclase (GGDEF)-like protein